MPKTRTILAAFIIALAGICVGAPANAAMTSTNCDWAVSNWSNVKVCLTITYHQPTASKYQIDKVKVEASSYGDTKRIEFYLILWDDGEAPGWDRNAPLSDAAGWTKVYTPDSLYVTTAGGGGSISGGGTAYFNSGGSGGFFVGAGID